MNASIAEEVVSRSLRQILDGLPVGADIPDTKDLRSALSALEYFVPQVLGEIHPGWRNGRDESLDGVLPVRSRKTADLEADISGYCILISDQALTPLHLRLQISPTDDVIPWFLCELGATDSTGAMVRIPFGPNAAIGKHLAKLEGSHAYGWRYRVTYGQQRET